MDHDLQAPRFEPLLCRNHIHEQFERPFTPVAHDLIVLNPDGELRIAKNASAAQIINFLTCANSKCAAVYDGETDDTAALTAMYDLFSLIGIEQDLILCQSI
jgi:hypothetical protein